MRRGRGGDDDGTFSGERRQYGDDEAEAGGEFGGSNRMARRGKKGGEEDGLFEGGQRAFDDYTEEAGGSFGGRNHMQRGGAGEDGADRAFGGSNRMAMRGQRGGETEKESGRFSHTARAARRSSLNAALGVNGVNKMRRSLHAAEGGLFSGVNKIQEREEEGEHFSHSRHGSRGSAATRQV
jgi:hypothetical protein